MKASTVLSSALVAVAVLAAVVDGARQTSTLQAQSSPVHMLPLAMRFAQDSATLYTEAQATAGAEVYSKVCVECHEKADVTNADFRSNWGGRTLFELYEEIRTTMPDDNPGALSRDEYAGAVAYILQLNGFAAGTTAVMPDSALMSAAKVEFPPPPPSQH